MTMTVQRKITSSIEPMEKHIEKLAWLDKCCGEISDLRAFTEDDIHFTFRRLRDIHNVRETGLIDWLHELTQEKLKGLAVQSDHVKPSPTA